MSEWQPIETAPKDVKVLGWSKESGHNLIYAVDYADFGLTRGIEYFNGNVYCKVSHWMPLPEPPKGVSDEQ